MPKYKKKTRFSWRSFIDKYRQSGRDYDFLNLLQDTRCSILDELPASPQKGKSWHNANDCVMRPDEKGIFVKS